ncbi:GRAM domain [Dillenia turbinata]|uniref:GRAM domain n=1 Tax=Dillenia turbinata TaxID=194707 RepID=A0AAN8U9K0_9MAGN
MNKGSNHDQTPPLYPSVVNDEVPIVDQPPLSSTAPRPQDHNQEAERWGTHIMGAPAVPTCHPDNKKAALWAAGDPQHYYHQHPYLQYQPIEKPTSPMESVLQVFNSWTSKTECLARNVWHNLKTGPSVSGAAWGKMNLTAKAITKGGFETLYKQTFAVDPNHEKLKKSFACYLSTSTGPVAGTLYLSNINVSFCSDRPLSFTAPSGQETWSYYKVMVPLSKIGTVNPVAMRENPLERYIQVITIDGHDFWFMGFVNYDKACHHLAESVSIPTATEAATSNPVS